VGRELQPICETPRRERKRKHNQNPNTQKKNPKTTRRDEELGGKEVSTSESCFTGYREEKEEERALRVLIVCSMKQTGTEMAASHRGFQTISTS